MSSTPPPLRVKEVDGTPSKKPIYEIVFPIDSLTVTGNSAEVSFTAPAPAEQNYTTDTVSNESGGQLLNGKAVRISGTNQVSYADNTSESNALVCGLMFETVADHGSGKIVTSGVVPTGHVSGFTSGDEVYLDTASGAVTATIPTTGVVVYIGKYNDGKLYLNIRREYSY